MGGLPPIRCSRPPARFIAPYDWLPAILESVLIAITRSHLAPVMSSLRPYQVLRRLYDTTEQEPHNAAGGMHELAADVHLREWLAGTTVRGGTSRVDGADTATTVDERAALAIDWLAGVENLVRGEFLPPNRGGRPGATFG